MKKTLLSSIMLLVCLMVSAQWSNDPAVNNRITPEWQNIYDSDFKVNKDGVTFIYFNAPKNGTTVSFLQILDKEGNKLFPDEGKIIAQERTLTYTMVNDLIMVDSDGNAILIVCDCRNSASDALDLSFTAYKVSPTGEMLWSEEGVDLCRGYANNMMAKMVMIQLEDGSYLFGWNQLTGYTESGEEMLGIQMERLSKEGELLWDQPIAIKSDTETYTYPYLVNAGNNQAILVYLKGTNQDIMARKIDFDGEPVWAQDTRVYRGGLPSVPAWVVVNVFPDPNGGVFVGWYDDRFFTNAESTYISYVKPNGSLAFPDGVDGLKVGNNDMLRSFSPDLIYSEKDNCIYVLWRETDANTQSYQRLVMQKVSMYGELLWDPEGVEIVPLQKTSLGYYSIRGAEDGNFAAFYMTNEGYGHVTASAVKYSSEGQALWDPETLVFSNYDSEKGNMTVSPLIGDDHWLAMWTENREKVEGIIYMQKIKTDASLGTGIAQVKDHPVAEFSSMVSGKEVIFFLNLEKQEDVNLCIYSLTGQKIASVYDGNLTGGKQELSYNTSDIPSGVYLATLTTSTGCRTIRVLLKQ